MYIFLLFLNKVWIGLLISIIVCVITYKVISFLAQRNNPTGLMTSLSDAFIYIFATITNHGDNDAITININGNKI